MKKTKLLAAMTLLAGGILVSTASNSHTGPGIPPGECICPDVWDPVCILETGQMFSNACHARCAGYSPDEYSACSF